MRTIEEINEEKEQVCLAIRELEEQKQSLIRRETELEDLLSNKINEDFEKVFIQRLLPLYSNFELIVTSDCNDQNQLHVVITGFLAEELHPPIIYAEYTKSYREYKYGNVSIYFQSGSVEIYGPLDDMKQFCLDNNIRISNKESVDYLNSYKKIVDLYEVLLVTQE